MPGSTRRIERIGGNGKDAYTFYPIVIVGAGESGICMGSKLQYKLGFDQFRIFDRRSGIGGTWHSNTYPGIACDVPAVFYSFSFAQNPAWSDPFPSGKAIVNYLYDVCTKYKLHDKIQCDTNVKSAKWMEADQQWELVLEHLAPGIGDMSSAQRGAFEMKKGPGSSLLRLERIRSKILVSAAGGLVEPKAMPDVPGLDLFEGKIMHTARWDNSVSLKDKSVVVLGTGCSAAQVIPQLIKPEYGAKHVTQLLRSPPWAVPFLAPEATEAWREWVPFLSTYIPGFQNTLRKLLFFMQELDFMQLFPPTEGARKRRYAKREELLSYMRKQTPAEYHEILTPDYEVYCKRRIIDDGWFQSLQDPRVEITSQPLTSLGKREVTLGPGRHFPPMEKTESKAPTAQRTIPCDVLVMANGYQTNEWLHPLSVEGKNEVSLYDIWSSRGGAQAYLGTAMDGFPNLFLIFGPNTATGHSSVILASENMSDYALNFIEPILRGDVKTYEVKESAERKWTADLQRDLKNSVFNSGGTNNWYVNKAGWNSTTYPRSQIEFGIRCMFPRWNHWNAEYTTKGLLRLWIGRASKVLLLLFMIVSTAYIRKYGLAEARKGSTDLVKPVFDSIKSWSKQVTRMTAERWSQQT